MKWFFSLLILISAHSTMAQTDSIRTKPAYTSLRVRMILKDTTAYAFTAQAGKRYKLYQFEIDSLYRGTYPEKKIWVMATDQEIRQFNSLKEANHDYWWALCPKITLDDGREVFRKCGAW